MALTETTNFLNGSGDSLLLNLKNYIFVFFWLPTTVIYEYENPVDVAMGLGRRAFLSWAQVDSTNKDQARPGRRVNKMLVGVN